MAVLLVLLGFGGFLRCIHPFLAVSTPVEAQVLVMEGWAADYAFRAGVREFERGEYSMIYVTGGPMGRGMPLSEYKTYSALGAAIVSRLGVPTDRIQAVPAPKVQRDRTYASALALRDWLEAHDKLPAALNVLSVGPHARRSRLLYEKAFGDECEIGVISVEDEDYDPKRWWSYSEGVRAIVGETAGYLYVRVFFRVSAERRRDKEHGENPVRFPPS